MNTEENNPLLNSVIYSERPIIEYWPQLAPILEEYGIQWHGGGVSDGPLMGHPKHIITIIDGNMGYWSDYKYGEITDPSYTPTTKNEIDLLERFKNEFQEDTFLHIDVIDIIDIGESMDNFFFESVEETNDLYNSVIYSKSPMINSWGTFVTILKDHGITEWSHGGTISEDETPTVKSNYVYIIKYGKLTQGLHWDSTTYEEATEEPLFRKNYGDYTHINIDELTHSEEMDNFFFESIIKKVLREESDWQWTEDVTEYSHYVPNVGDRFIRHGYGKSIDSFANGTATDEIVITKIKYNDDRGTYGNPAKDIEFIDTGSYELDPYDIDFIHIEDFREDLKNGDIEVLELQ